MKNKMLLLIGLFVWLSPAPANAQSVNQFLQNVEGRSFSLTEIQSALEEGGCDELPRPVQDVCLLISLQFGGERAKSFVSATNGISPAKNRASVMNRQYSEWKKVVAPTFNWNRQSEIIQQHINSVGN